MNTWIGIAAGLALAAGATDAQTVTIRLQPSSSFVQPGGSFTVSAIVNWSNIPSLGNGNALAGFALDIDATAGASNIASIGFNPAVNIPVSLRLGARGSAQSNGIEAVGGQLANVFGRNPSINTSQNIHVLQFTVTTSASADGPITFNVVDQLNIKSAVSVYNDRNAAGQTDASIGQINLTVIPATVNVNDCPADVNGDGQALPNDFSAWIAAFNTQAPGCDQNGDGQCLPNDFSAWIANFNAGCN
jgi:hypothetical protein